MCKITAKFDKTIKEAQATVDKLSALQKDLGATILANEINIINRQIAMYVWSACSQSIGESYSHTYDERTPERPVKPPIGIPSRGYWRENRKRELAEAISRYYAAYLQPPKEWLSEFEEYSK